MAVHTRDSWEDDAQVRGTVGDLDSHELLDAFGVAQGWPNKQMPQMRSVTYTNCV